MAQTVDQYGTKLKYGIGGDQITIGGCTGILTSATLTAEGETKTYKGQDGVTCTLVITEKYQTISMDVLMLQSSSSSLPKKGDTVSSFPEGITVQDGLTFRVESCSVQFSNEDVAKYSITARGYPFSE